MVHKELPQAWWFDSHNVARPSPWLNNTLSELDDKTKQMLALIDQDADSFAQRAEMYYKKRLVLVDMLGDLYRTHRSLAEQYDLLKHGGGARHTVFGLSSCAQSRSSSQAPSTTSGGKTTPGSSCSASAYDSESEVDDPEQEEEEEHEEELTRPVQQEQRQQEQQEQVELMRAEIESLKAQNAAVRKAAEEDAAAMRAELAGKDEEKREVIRQLASSMDVMRQENLTLREHIIRESKQHKHASSSSSRGFVDLKKVARDLFSARRLFTAHCRPTGPIVAL
ncbi:hypothetical protein U9M48_016138 [Paspalum notatum var. saurae]|uniref:NAB domain-containing protein n=1 Tax=Paspalum notatum var. saurae TaxID=547442 RepID=A0AAQ3T5L0_PASNO